MSFPRLAPLLCIAALTLSGCAADDTAGDDTAGDDMAGDDMAGDDMAGDDMAGDDDHGDHGDAPAVVEGARTVQVTASSFAFDPDTIELDAGEDVALELTSTDILHDFVIDEVDFHVAADGGESNTGGLHIAEPGSYTAYCSVAGHREAGMEATVVVTE